MWIEAETIYPGRAEGPDRGEARRPGRRGPWCGQGAGSSGRAPSDFTMAPRLAPFYFSGVDDLNRETRPRSFVRASARTGKLARSPFRRPGADPRARYSCQAGALRGRRPHRASDPRPEGRGAYSDSFFRTTRCSLPVGSSHRMQTPDLSGLRFDGAPAYDWAPVLDPRTRIPARPRGQSPAAGGLRAPTNPEEARCAPIRPQEIRSPRRAASHIVHDRHRLPPPGASCFYGENLHESRICPVGHGRP